jgi:hypothetical protein
MVGGLCCFWVCSKEVHYDGSNMAEETVHFMAVGRQRERDRPGSQYPFSGTPQ